MNSGYLWWKDVQGAIQYWNRICQVLEEGKHVILENAAKQPWPEILREHCCNVYLSSKYTPAVNINAIDDKDIVSKNGGDILRYILAEFCFAPQVRNGYRAGANISPARYLQDHDILKNTIFWVKDITPERFNVWMTFIKGCESRGIRGGLFVLESGREISEVQVDSAIGKICYTSSIASYNFFIFCMQMLTEKFPDLSLIRLNYIATVISTCCGCHLELAAEVIENTSSDDFIKKPMENIFKERLSRHGQDLGETMPESTKLPRCVWRAQLQVLLPVVEEFRIKLLADYKVQFQNAISGNEFSSSDVYGNNLQNIEDLELSNILYYVNRHQEIFAEGMSENVQFMRDTRNLLAHHSICPPETISRLLQWNLT